MDAGGLATAEDKSYGGSLSLISNLIVSSDKYFSTWPPPAWSSFHCLFGSPFLSQGVAVQCSAPKCHHTR